MLVGIINTSFFFRRAKLIQSLKNKIPPEYPASDVHSNIEDDYPHPNHGTLKNEILQARSKISKKPPAPRDWSTPSNRQSYAEPTPRSEYNLPPRDYPGFTGSNNSQFNRKPYHQNNDNLPPRNFRGLSRQEAEVMKQYDQTIANEERHFQNPQGFLHGRYAK